MIAASLSFAQVRQRLAISDSTLRRIIKRGDLRACRVGRQWRFSQTDLELYLRARQSKPSEKSEPLSRALERSIEALQESLTI